MAYIGKQVTAGQTETVKDSFNGDNSTTAFTMSQSVSLDTDIEVFVGNVQQEPGSGKAYVVSGTTLTFSEAPPTGTGNIYVIHRNSLQGTLLPPQNLGDKNYLIGGNLSLDADSAALKFGADSEITVTHVADTGLNIKHTATADDKPVVLTLQTGETDIAQDDVLGTINFQAPDEGTGTDAILVAAGISAISEGDFSSSSNATKLSFKTGASEAASEKMSLSSAGNLTVSGDISVGDDLSFTSDSAVLKFGADSDTTLTHTDGTGLTLNSTNKLCFNDATQFIQGASGTVLDIAATDEIELTATLIDVVGNLAGSGTGTFGGILKTDDTTDATSTTDGSLQTDGGLSVAKDVIIGDDLSLLSDSSVINFGADKDVSIIHQADNGLIIKNNLTSDGSQGGLVLQTGETNIEQGDVLGRIQFQAPDEATGTDAILVAAEISAESEGDFSSSSNATSLVFKTGASEAAASKMTLDSAGNFNLSAQPRFSVYRGNAEQISNDSNAISVAEYVDFSSNSPVVELNVGSDFTTNNGRFTAPVDGYYQFNASLLTGMEIPSSGTNAFYLSLFLNGAGGSRMAQATIVYKEFYTGTGTGATYSFFDAVYTTQVTLSAGDYVNLGFFHTNSQAVRVHSGLYSYFQGRLVC